MKQIKCNTGKQEFLLVGVPKDANNVNVSGNEVIIYHTSSRYPSGELYLVSSPLERKHNFVGLYTPSKNEIDFEVKEEWVENRVSTMSKNIKTGVENHLKVYEDYYGKGDEYDIMFTYKDSFLSFLKSVTQTETIEKWVIILINQ